MPKHNKRNTIQKNLRSKSNVSHTLGSSKGASEMGAIWEQYDFQYILVHMKRAYPSIPEEVQKDLAQDILISLWRKLEQDPVENPVAYIARMIRNRGVDHFRQCKKHSRIEILPIDDYVKVVEDSISVARSENMGDPAQEILQRSSMGELLNEIVDALLKLPSRQQHAFACLLWEKVDDLLQLQEALQAHNIDMQQIRWPEDKAEKQLLKASLHAAKLFLAQRLHVDLALYKRKKQTAKNPILSIPSH
jgi:DNA-directed RNA polymerase specialized sigma24 family protein